MNNLTFRDWCKERYEEGDDDFCDDCSQYVMVRIIKGVIDGRTYKEMTDKIWRTKKMLDGHKRYLQTGLDKLYLKYIYYRGL